VSEVSPADAVDALVSRTAEPCRSSVAIVGAGPGGLCAAMLLAHRGFDVTVIEKQPVVGGRSSGFELGPYRFDLGSTLLMMRFVVEEMFELVGRRLQDEVEIRRVDPMYRLVFGDRWLDVFADPTRMDAELRRFAPNSEPGLMRFLEREHERLRHLYPLMQRTWPTLASLADTAVMGALPWVGLGKSLHETAAQYFPDDDVALGFSFQAAYLGMSPWECPGGFGMVPYVEHAWGVDYVMGGIHRLCDAMARVATDCGAKILFEDEVTRILGDDSTSALELASGTRLQVNDVILDADAADALIHLFDRNVSLRFNKRRLAHLEESCSTFMMYLGLDRTLPLGHHTFFFADDYHGEMERVFRAGKLHGDLSIYACNPVVTDPSVAPEGHSALYLLALAPNTRKKIPWETQAPRMRRQVLAQFERRTGVDLAPLIREERIVTPAEWESRYHISHGAVFGPSHGISQLLALRLPHQLPSPGNVFLTGAGTSPGSGIPTILESARIATRLVCERHGVSFPPSRPLPEPTTWQRPAEDPIDLPIAPFEAEYLGVV
jgi:phytoene desaturase